jgi:hypothetical protein
MVEEIALMTMKFYSINTALGQEFLPQAQRP